MPAVRPRGSASSGCRKLHGCGRLAEGKLAMQTVTAGEGELAISLTVEETDGNGIVVLALGGTKPHVGGVAVAVPRMKSTRDGLTADVSQICVPGHKDVYMAAELAKLFAVETEQQVSVTAGVHVDNADGAQIAEMMDNARSAARMWLEAHGN